MHILEVHNLTKKYDTFTAVDNISFSIPEGKVVGFLGPNGAGKTTTIQILCGITLANGGTIHYFGKDFSSNRQYCLQRINFASAFNTLLGKITVWENLLVYAGLYQVKHPKKKIMELIEQFEASSLLHELYWDLSAGQKTRVNLVKALINDPKVLLLDEPTASLDPDIADKTLSYIHHLRKEKQITILYTSHNMEEVTRICDEVMFIDRGKIAARDTPVNLTRKITTVQLQLTFDNTKHAMQEYLEKHQQKYFFIDTHIVAIETTEQFIPKLIFGITKTNIMITDIMIKKPTLEDVFLQIARGGNN